MQHFLATCEGGGGRVGDGGESVSPSLYRKSRPLSVCREKKGKKTFA